MAIQEAVIGAIADLLGIAINAIARHFGKSEVESKKIESYITYALISGFVIFLLYITLKYG